MENINKKDLEHKLYIQHNNTRHDAINIINAYFVELDDDNEKLRIRCTQQLPHLKFGCTFNQYKYDSEKKHPDRDELTKRIHNMKQRKPKKDE